MGRWDLCLSIVETQQMAIRIFKLIDCFEHVFVLFAFYFIGQQQK